MALILEMGANTIRLAHYQHAQAFYDLCDEKGVDLGGNPLHQMHMQRRANTLTQMEELSCRTTTTPALLFGTVQRNYRCVGCQ
ncbi:MAG: glycoside hydrolase family 2 TIM barrel-domain containing protein [Faecalibacterium sp.]